MSAGTVYTCALCNKKVRTQERYLLHLLQERGAEGLTTGQAVKWGAGTRAIGGRIHDLRNAGHRIDGVKLIGSPQWLYTLVDVEGGDARSLSSSAAPVTTLSADSIPRRWFCNHERACMGKPLDGPVCPRGADHPTYTAHHVDLLPAPVADRLAA